MSRASFRARAFEHSASSNLSGFYRTAKLKAFPTQFLPGPPLQVENGKVYGNLIVNSNGTARLNPIWIGLCGANGVDLSTLRIGYFYLSSTRWIAQMIYPHYGAVETNTNGRRRLVQLRVICPRHHDVGHA